MLNLPAVLRFDLGRDDGTIVSTAREEIKLANIAVAVVSSLLLGTLVGYYLSREHHASSLEGPDAILSG